MEAEGVTFKPGVNVGVDVEGGELLAQFDAICLTGGATHARDLDVPGPRARRRVLRDGVPAAAEQAQRRRRDPGRGSSSRAEGKRVIILGGGDTGADCLGTAHPPGRERDPAVRDCCRGPPTLARTRTPWPTWPNIYRVSSAHEEGGVRDYSILTKSLSGEDGVLKKLHAVRVEFVNEDGRQVMKEVPGSEFEVDVDLLLLAMGFLGPERGGMLEQLGVELTNAAT